MNSKYCSGFEEETDSCSIVSKWVDDGKPCKCVYNGKKCRLFEIYKYIEPSEEKEQLPQLTQEIREKLVKRIAERWRKRKKGSGGRYEIGGSLERVLLEIFKEKIGSHHVSKPTNKRKSSDCSPYASEWCNMQPDIMIKKDNKVTYIECKVTVSPESFRDAFARAYFLKRHKAEKPRFYLIGTHFYKYRPKEKENFEKIINAMKENANGYIDGIYFIGHKPYVDKFFEENESAY